MKRCFGETSEFYCVFCGNKGIPVFRKNSTQREAGHLKKLFCLNCNKETNHIEIRQFAQRYTYEDMKLEFEYQNFDKEGNRIYSIGQLRRLIHDGKITKK